MAQNVKEIMNTLAAIQKTAKEVTELMQKSLAKADDDSNEDPSMPPSEDPAPVADPTPAPDAPPAPNAAPEGGEGGGEIDELAQEISSMDDEELAMLLEVLAEEFEKRQTASAPAEGSPAPDAGTPPPPPSPDMQAMKSENAYLKKSLADVSARLEKLEKSSSKPAGKPAQTNKPVSVLNKSEPAKELLSKSEVLTHLESLKKSGNRAVNSDLVWLANKANTVEDMKNVYHEAKLKGIEIPHK